MDPKGVRWLDFQSLGDARGGLAVVESERHVPFPIARVFTVYNVPAESERGGHAHWQTEQVLVAMAGSIAVDLDDGINKQRYLLDNPTRGLYVPTLVWDRLYEFSSNAVLTVFASRHYEAADYIRNREEFEKAVRSER
jgi:hypothetical protein